jgi:hypothetical protein
MTRERHLILGVVAGGVGLLQALQDDVHRLHDVASRAQIPGDPRDRRHDKVPYNFGHVPHQGRQAPGLNDTVYLSVLKEPLELNEQHQLVTVVLHQCHLMQVQVPLCPIELDLLLP